MCFFYLKKRSDGKMCKKIKELNGLSAEDLLKKTGQENSIPVDISQICYDLNIRLQDVDFTKIEQNEAFKSMFETRGSILGVVLANNDELAILYRKTDTNNRKRFTIAHELAHCCIHMDSKLDTYIEFRLDEYSEDEREIQANKFAGELLIPEKSLKNIIGETSYLYSSVVNLLSRAFAVSEKVMCERLKCLGIQIIM